jgi:trans-aconitate methyltransferase
MSGQKDVYDSHPAATPYTSTERYGKPKEDFKAIARRLAALPDRDHPCRLADIGCANGELLHYLRGLFPGWSLHGFDRTLEFIDTARSAPELKAVHLEHRDLYEIDGTFDIVVSTCFLPLFTDIEKPLTRMLDLCAAGGWLLSTGMFNPYDIEVRVEFSDNTHAQSRDVWRQDFNRHSQASIRRLFGKRVQRIEFEDCAYDDLVLPQNPDNPIRVWTMKDSDGRTLLINGAFQLCNQTLLVIQK